MVFHAGGRRLTSDERGNDEAENADYLIDELVVEAKDLQEERLAKGASHEKIAEIFWPYFEEAAVIPLDSSLLSEVDWHRYIDILARPIESAVKKASRQVKATTARTGMAGGSERGQSTNLDRIRRSKDSIGFVSQDMLTAPLGSKKRLNRN